VTSYLTEKLSKLRRFYKQ